jgi:GH35 family endo-1,4-beta-xylanase
MLAKDALLTMKQTGREYGTFRTVSVQGMPFTQALQVTTSSKPPKYYSVQAKLMSLPAIKDGDVLLASFYARCTAGGTIETSQGQIAFGIQDKDTQKAIGRFTASPGGEWQRFLIPMTATEAMPSGKAALALSFGAMLQTVEIGGLEVINYGHKLAEKDLPVTKVTYEGREADAPWRAEAKKRIEQYRKADVNVVVKDAEGKPVPDATVDVTMQKYAFQFGAAITNRAVVDQAVAPTIFEKHSQLFNQGLSVGYFLWRYLEEPDGTAHADTIVKYLRDHGMTTRAHVLVWEREDHFPDDVLAMIKNGQKDKLHQRIADHITKTVTQYRGRIDEWVVENEAVDNSEIRKVLGEASIAEWFKVAHAADPKAKLMINENRTEGLKPDKSDRLLELVKIITDNGGPLDTIGIQGHMGSTPPAPETVLKHFDKLAATGKTLAITEYDFDSTDEQLKADYTRDFLTLVFSHPSFNCFTMWRFWDGKPEKRESVVYANDWTMRPSGKAYQDLVFNQWWTKETGKTDAAGQFATRGFLGDYEVTVSRDGKTQTARATLLKDQPNTVEIILK